MEHKELARCSSQVLRIVLASALIAVAPLVMAAAAAPPPAPVMEPPPAAPPTPTGTLDRVRAAGKIVLGYRTDARPLSYADESGHAAGYAATLCQKVADDIKVILGMSNLAVEWVAVSAAAGPTDVQSGAIDLLCGADITLTQRETVSFSIPIFLGGIAALLRTDASDALQDALEQRPPPYQPLWRGSTPQSIKALQKRTVAVVGGTAIVDLLVARMAALKINSTVAPVDSYATGIASVVDRKSDMLVGDRAVLLDLAKRDAHARDLRVLTRHFTFQPIALALHRDDDAFRLVVDRALSALYATPAFGDLYVASFGPLDAETTGFFRMTIVPQ